MKRIAFVGCGFVADDYIHTLSNHPELQLVGVMDQDHERCSKFGEVYNVDVYSSLKGLLTDPQVDIVVNLTTPGSHYAVSKAALEHGKHVYSEKPLAMAITEAQELVEIAEKQGLYIASAPCNVLGETAQTLWKALRDNHIGTVRLVYAEMDDGPIFQMSPQNWRNRSGTPWPYKNEYEVGCTMEHAGYFITWLAAFFGPASAVTAFSCCIVPNKVPGEKLDPPDTPDFSVACIHFKSGVVARLTCSIIASHDHSIRIIGSKGILATQDCWHYGSPVMLHKYSSIAFKAGGYPLIQNNAMLKKIFGLSHKKLPFVIKPQHRYLMKRDYMDFARGVNELAAAISGERPCRLSARFSLHVNEIVLAIQNALETGNCHQITSEFEPVEPMSWAI